MTGAIIPGFPRSAMVAWSQQIGDRSAAFGLASRIGARRAWSFGHGPKTTTAVPVSDAVSTGRRTDMHAVIKTGGKQYRVAPGDTVKVETLTAEVGQQVTLSEVLAVSNGDDVKVGSPFVAGAAVVATVVGHGRHDKVTIFKMKRRKHYQKHQGHRQNFTELRIDSIA